MGNSHLTGKVALQLAENNKPQNCKVKKMAKNVLK